ncbi:hypothetical protein [Azospirillum endophyticum]
MRRVLARFHDLFTLLAGRLGGGARPPLPDLGGWPVFGALRKARLGVLGRRPGALRPLLPVQRKDRPGAEPPPVLVVDSSRR